MSKPAGAYTRKPTEQELAAVRETAALSVDAVNPGDATSEVQPPALSAEPEQIQIDPAVLHQLIQNKNAKLIAMMVHESSLLEATADQYARQAADWQAKYEALLASLED